MKYLFILLFLISGTGLWAQTDKPTGGISIPRAKTDVAPEPAAPSTESHFSITPKKKSDYNYPTLTVGEDKSNFSMYPKDEFVSRAPEFQDKINASVQRKGESNVAFRGNQFFGEVKSKSKTIQVLARDFEYVDGDRIKVWVNDRVVVPEIILDSNFRGIQITLQEGFNKIDFEALNQGTSGPNTAEFRVYDDKEEMISNNQWNLATGFKATVIVVKESETK